MSDNENIIKQKTKSELWNIIGTIIKSIIVLLIIGFIMFYISYFGSQIYSKNSWGRNYTSGWLYHEYLDPCYGLIGLIIYILTNCFGFLSYNHIMNRFKNYKINIANFLFILFSIFINILMLLLYSQLFADFSFENVLLEFINNVIIGFGRATFPIIFLIIYRQKCKSKD